MTPEEHKRFALMELPRVVGIGHVNIEGAISATASQRAEAFLRTIGKWKA